MENINTRKIALEILVEMDNELSYSNVTLNKYTKQLKPVERGFVTQIVYGVIENKIYLDYVIRQLSSVRLKKISVQVLNILRMSLYQIIFMDKVPDSAAVNEAVKMTKKIQYKSSGFVNGILRAYLRAPEKIKLPDRMADLTLYLSVKYSHPQWLVERWITQFGVEFTEDLLVSNNSTPSLCVRVNTLKISRDQLLDHFDEAGIIAVKGEYVDDAVIIEKLGKQSLTNLEAFKKGYFTVQDESSMHVGMIADPSEGDLVIDLCSAPGGKATHMAQKMKNKGRILSFDIYDHKLDKIRENAERLGISIIETRLQDATELDPTLVGLADVVLTDVPCSGLGIIRRKPEIRYTKSVEDLTSLSDIQGRILENGARYVKVGGHLVYSTCTIEPEENQMIIENFIRENKNFSVVEINGYLNPKIEMKDKWLSLFPHLHGLDGFFICKMERKY